MPRPTPQVLFGVLFLACLLAPRASAQFDPSSGEWGKDEPHQVRVMTWNVHDTLCSTSDKQEGQNGWTALARSVAAFRPDVLVLQETADNSGNGTGSGADSVSEMQTVLDLFLHGGSDPFDGGATVTSYVQKYAPAYDLPHVFVASRTDNFNRNAVLSRFPFADLNGDGESTYSDIPFVSADEWAPGGNGGIRGFQFVELDLPDGIYRGDLVVGNAHLKAGGGNDDEDDRRAAAQNVSYVVEHLYNGAGTGTPDPNGKIGDSPQVQTVLGADTAVVLAGDWNEDESTNGQKGPAEWLVDAELAFGDGTDRDGSAMTYDDAEDFGGSDNTLGSKKLDYIAWQDSIATLANQFLFHSNSVPLALLPPEMQGFSSPVAISSWASDHKPVICDLELPRMIIDPVCFADGQSSACPCFNFPAASDEGCANSTGLGGILNHTGSANVAADDLVLISGQCSLSQSGVFLQGAALAPQPFRDGILCVGLPTERLEFVQTDFFGQAATTVSIVTEGGNLPGLMRYYQFWYRDPGGPCGQGSNLTHALRVVWQ